MNLNLFVGHLILIFIMNFVFEYIIFLRLLEMNKSLHYLYMYIVQYTFSLQSINLQIVDFIEKKKNTFF